MPGYHEYQKSIESTLRCAALCNHCASACLQEDDVKKMARCIQIDMECAAICYATAQVMSLGGETVKQMCQLCADICDMCAEECEKHDMQHCKECAEACRKSAADCRSMAGVAA